MATTAALYALSTTGQQASFAALQDTLAVVPSYTGFQLQLALAQGELATTLYFELDPKGLLLARPSDTLLLFDKEGNTVGIVGDLLSDRGMAHDVNYTVTPLDNGNYLLAATLPRSSSGSAYTMSITLDYDDLIDATICSSEAQQNASYPNSATLWVGYYPYSGYERVLIRPTNWTLTSSALPNYTVTSAQLTLRDVTVTSTEATIECRSFTGNVWDEGATWVSANGNSVGTVWDTNAVSSSIGWNNGYYYTFDITQLAQQWYTGTTSWQKGVIFTWQNATATQMEKGFASTEYSNENYRPKIVVNYEYLPPLDDGVYVFDIGDRSLDWTSHNLYGSGISLSNYDGTSLSATGTSHSWRIKYVGEGYYTIRPIQCTLQGLCYDNGLYTAYIGSSDNTAIADAAKWKIIKVDGKYMLSPCQLPTMAISVSSTGAISLVSLDTSNASQKWTLTRRYVNTTNSNNCYAERIYAYNEETGEIIGTSPDSVGLFVGDSVSVDDLGVVFTIATEGSLSGVYPSWVNYEDSPCAEIDVLSDGYYIRATNTGAGAIVFEYSGMNGYLYYNIPILIGSLSGTQYLKNHGFNLYASNQVPTGQTGDVYLQYDFGNVAGQWVFNHVGNGYYTIRANSPEALYLCADVSEGEVEFVSGTESSVSSYNGTKWRIEKTASNKYRLYSKMLESTGQVLASLDTVYNPDGNVVVMRAYTADAVYDDEWGIRCTTQRVVQHGSMWCWAACVQMLELKYQPNSKTQEQMVLEVGFPGQTAEDVSADVLDGYGAQPSQIRSYLSSLTGQPVASKNLPIETEEDLCDALDVGNLVIRITETGDSKHATVVYDYDSLGNTVLFSYYDPAFEDVERKTFDELVIELSGTEWKNSIYYEIGDYRHY